MSEHDHPHEQAPEDREAPEDPRWERLAALEELARISERPDPQHDGRWRGRRR